MEERVLLEKFVSGFLQGGRVPDAEDRSSISYERMVRVHAKARGPHMLGYAECATE